MRLDIYNQGLERIGTLKKYECLIWRRRYNKTGAFELYLAFEDKLLNLMQEDNIIHKIDDKEAGIIEYINFKKDITGKEMISVKGRFLKSYLERRIIWGTQNINDTFENVVRLLVNNNAINPLDIKRKIPLLELGVLNNYSGATKYQISYKNLLEEIENLSITSEIGNYIKLDNRAKKLIFETCMGLDRSANQNKNPRCIFSRQFNNVLEQEYTFSKRDYKNVNLVAGAGEGKDRKTVLIGEVNKEGLERYELYTDARDLQDKKTIEKKDAEGNTITEDIPIPLNEYLEILKQRGKEKLSTQKKFKVFDSKINVNSNLKYKKNYDLGDIVTVLDKRWKVSIDRRITEIEEIYNSKGQEINITFGEGIPTILDRME